MTATRTSRIVLALVSATVAVAVAVASWPERADDRVRFAAHSDADLAKIERLAAGLALESSPDPSASGAPGLLPLPRRPLGPDLAELLLPLGEARGNVYDPQIHYRYGPHFELQTRFPQHPAGGWRVRTNSLGLKGEREVMSERPGLRILVVGDSHTDGFCADEESFARRLEGELSSRLGGIVVESLNAGHTGYSFYHYLGALERYLHLQPDVFVVASYSGNDFVECLGLRRAFEGTLTREFMAQSPRFVAKSAPWPPGFVAQYLRQVYHFAEVPADEAIAIDTATRACQEMASICRDNGIVFVPFLLPTFVEVQPDGTELDLAVLAADLALTPSQMDTARRLADAWIASMRRHGMDVLDARPHFASATEKLYWPNDYHISIAGNAHLAPWLADAIHGRLPARASAR